MDDQYEGFPLIAAHRRRQQQQIADALKGEGEIRDSLLEQNVRLQNERDRLKAALDVAYDAICQALAWIDAYEGDISAGVWGKCQVSFEWKG